MDRGEAGAEPFLHRADPNAAGQPGVPGQTGGIIRDCEEAEEMTRGPDSEKAIEWAAAIAALRGDVWFFRKIRDRPCDFMIVNESENIFVATKRTRRLYRSVGELEAEYREMIENLRAVPNPAIERQFWLFSRKGRYRIFRITPAGMEELPVRGPSLGQVGTGVKISP